MQCGGNAAWLAVWLGLLGGGGWSPLASRAPTMTPEHLSGLDHGCAVRSLQLDFSSTCTLNRASGLPVLSDPGYLVRMPPLSRHVSHHAAACSLAVSGRARSRDRSPSRESRVKSQEPAPTCRSYPDVSRSEIRERSELKHFLFFLFF